MEKNKILILGAKGLLGGQFMKVFGDEAIGWDKEEFDITKIADFKLQISKLQPKVVINCAAYNDVDGAETHRDIAYKINAEAVGNLAGICRQLNLLLVHFSTNYVFDGEKGEYQESDLPNPQSVYAKSKYQGELELQKNCDKCYLIRTALLFGPKGESEQSKKSFVEMVLDKSRKTDTIKMVDNEINSCTYAPDLALAVKGLLGQPYGVYHITNGGEASWYEFAEEIIKLTGKKINLIPVSSAEFPRAAKRPQKAVLINTKLPQLRSWQEALKEYLNSES